MIHTRLIEGHRVRLLYVPSERSLRDVTQVVQSTSSCCYFIPAGIQLSACLACSLVPFQSALQAYLAKAGLAQVLLAFLIRVVIVVIVVVSILATLEEANVRGLLLLLLILLFASNHIDLSR